MRAKIYESKADVELLRCRLATTPNIGLSDAVRKSSPTLLANTRTFYKGAVDHGRALGEDEIVKKGKRRCALVNEMIRLSSQGAGSSSSPSGASVAPAETSSIDLMGTLSECVEEGLIDADVANELMEKVI
jgi:hypothetical protein